MNASQLFDLLFKANCGYVRLGHIRDSAKAHGIPKAAIIEEARSRRLIWRETAEDRYFGLRGDAAGLQTYCENVRQGEKARAAKGRKRKLPPLHDDIERFRVLEF